MRISDLFDYDQGHGRFDRICTFIRLFLDCVYLKQSSMIHVTNTKPATKDVIIVWYLQVVLALTRRIIPLKNLYLCAYKNALMFRRSLSPDQYSPRPAKIIAMAATSSIIARGSAAFSVDGGSGPASWSTDSRA